MISRKDMRAGMVIANARGSKLTIIEHDFYDCGKPILCGATEYVIVDLDDVDLDKYDLVQ